MNATSIQRKRETEPFQKQSNIPTTIENGDENENLEKKAPTNQN